MHGGYDREEILLIAASCRLLCPREGVLISSLIQAIYRHNSLCAEIL